MSKGTFWRKHILRMAAVLPVIAVLCMFGIHANAEKSNLSADVRKQEDRFYPSEEEAGRLAETLPILCTPVEATYQKNEDGPGFSEELLADLQEYVRRGELAEAIDAYRDETLLINVEELRLLCPDYESLLAEWMKEQQGIGIKAEDVTDKIRQIYALGQDDGEEPLLLLECSDFEIPWYYIKKEEAGYQIGVVRLEGYGSMGWERCERALFAVEDGYCLLLRGTARSRYTEEKELLRICRFTLQEEDSVHFPVKEEEEQYIRERITRVMPVFFYVNGASPLTPAVQEYVEENAAVFADRISEYEVIWGDEEYAEPPEKSAEILWTESDKQDTIRDWEWMDYVCQADYDNDGRKDLFWRGFLRGRRENALLVEDEGGYRTAYVRFFAQDVLAEQMWFVEFEGKIITFEIAGPYGAACPFLSAYLIEENKKTPILTCQLVFGQTVEIDRDQYGEYYRDSFGIKPVVPLLADLEEETEEQAAFREKLAAWIREIGEDVTITPTDNMSMDTLSLDTSAMEGGVTIPEDFLDFIREGAVWCLSGRRFSEYVSPYEVDTERDLAEFIEKYEMQQPHTGYRYEMAYHWEAKDGTDNYLVSKVWDFDAEINTLCWYRDDGAGLYEKESITDLCTHYGSYCGVLLFGGRLYCVIEERDTWISPMRIDLVALGDAGEWEHYCVSLTYESEQYDTHALYAADVPAALLDYMAEESEEILMCMNRLDEIYEGRGTYDELPKDVWRNIKNRDISYAAFSSGYYIYGSTPYRAVDVDNDGEAEYAAAYYMSGRRGPSFFSHTVYGRRDGSFVELSLTGEGLLDLYADDDGVYGVHGSLEQLWFEEFDGVTYLFTVEELSLFDSYLLRVRVIRDGEVHDVGAWLFRRSGAVLEDIQKMEEYESWMSA